MDSASQVSTLFSDFMNSTPNVSGECSKSYEEFKKVIGETTTGDETTKTDISNILNLFDVYGLLEGNAHTKKEELLDIDEKLSATTHSDLYKFMMVHVFKVVEEVNEGVTVRFSVDFRNKDLESTLLNNIERLKTNLSRLCNREFDKNIFEPAYIKTPHLTYKKTGLNGKLANEVIGQRTEIDSEGLTNVIINVLPMEIEGEKKLIVEAVGPWHKVTWLETSMMQACYETYLRIKLKESEKTYGAWLKEALFRCYLSINEANKAFDSAELSGALFSGRRTGGYAFTLLQVYLISKLYNGKTPFRGTSSVDAHWQLSIMITDNTVTGINNNQLLLPVGTHAHEQSMGLQGVLKEQLGDKAQLPLSQLLAHYLYYRVVKLKQPGPPMPMLADTLSTKAFLLTGGLFNENGSKNDYGTGDFLKFILSSRQDSGELPDIQKAIRDAKEKGILGEKAHNIGIMASEISTPDDLQKIVSDDKDISDYNSFGAGGFFGDGHKAWTCVTPIFKSPSLAVKATEVHTKKGTGYPIKLSDSKGKISLLKTTDPNVLKLLDNVVVNSAKIKIDSNINIGKMKKREKSDKMIKGENPMFKYLTKDVDLEGLIKPYDDAADEIYPITSNSGGKRNRTRKRPKRTKRRSQRKKTRSSRNCKRTRRGRR